MITRLSTSSFTQKIADPGGVLIRRATGDDAHALGRLTHLEARLHERLGGYALTADFDWTAWTAARLRTPGHCCFIAEGDATPLGYVYGRMRSLPKSAQAPVRRDRLRRAVRGLLRRSTIPSPGSPVCYEGWGMIESLYLLKSERRKGLGRRLVEAARNDLAELGATRIEISVMAANEAAMAFWSKLGFVPFRAHMVLKID